MKTCITFLGFMAFFLIGMQNSIAQEVQDATSEAALKQTTLDNEHAKDQTYALHKLVNLSGAQVPKIHQMFLDIDTKDTKVSTDTESNNSMKKTNDKEGLKKEMLKEILTDSQYELYLKSIQ